MVTSPTPCAARAATDVTITRSDARRLPPVRPRPSLSGPRTSFGCALYDAAGGQIGGTDAAHRPSLRTGHATAVIR